MYKITIGKLKMLLNYIRMFRSKGVRLPITYFKENHLFDIIHDTDTHKKLEISQYHQSTKNLEHAVLYMASWTSVINKATTYVTSQLKKYENEVELIDVGSGKGKVLCTWRKDGYLNKFHVTGIEVNKELVRISQRNLRVIGAQNFTLFEKDVLDFEFTQQDTIYVIYLYNPFDEYILRQFLNKLYNRLAIIIYVNPVHKKILDNFSFRLMIEKISWHPSCTFSIFKSESLQ